MGAHELETGGMSPSRLARMHDTLLRHVENGRLPGLVALVSRRGAERAEAIGALAFDRAAPMRRDLLTFRSGYGEVAFLSPTCPAAAGNDRSAPAAERMDVRRQCR